MLFWYSAYPDLTTERIRINAAIRQGLASAESEADAADWLACFGSSPRPPDALETAEIPALAFGGLVRFVIRPLRRTMSGNAQECSDWLKVKEPGTAWARCPTARPRRIGLAASALQRIGIPVVELSTFPVAFQQGMGAEPCARARRRGSAGSGEMEMGWPGDRARDAIVLLYAQSDGELRAETEVRSLTAELHHMAGATQWLPPRALTAR